MNGPYYRNHSRSVPVQKPKVVSIPVHFVSSDHQKPQTNKHSSAVKIQKVYRGHTVRNSVKKIVSIKNQVNEIEKRLKNDAVFVELLRNDAKERLRVNETLMSLLFKLDSVRGVDNGVRELRKSVAKKAVALQDKLDSIAQSHHDDVSNDEETELCDGDDVSKSMGNKVNEEDVKDVVDDDVCKYDQKSESVEEHVNDDVICENRDQEELVVNEAMKDDSMKECDDDVSSSIGNKVTGEDVKEVVDDGFSKNDQNPKSVEDDFSNENGDMEELVVNEAMNEDPVKECDDDVSSDVRNRESVENEEGVKEAVENRLIDYDVSKSCCDDETVVNEDRVTDEGIMKECGGGDDEVSKSCCDKGMVEKLMCDNAKMMKLMIQISERNEMQTRMINSLSRRVEQLEKAFMSDKSRRRKKSSTRREKDGFSI